MISRRRLLTTIGLGAGTLGLGLRPDFSVEAASDSITFVSWGGTTQDAQKKVWTDPFTSSTGVKVVHDGPTDYGKFKAMVESGNVSWDVVDMEGQFALRFAKQGLLEPIDYTVVKKAGLDPRLSFEYGVGSFMSSYVLAYNKDFMKGNPQTWVDFFDLAKYPGKRAVYKWAGMGALEIALLGDGVAPKDLYPLNLDRAFAKLDTIKSDIIWWGSGAQSQQLLASGETPIGMFWNGRLYAMEKEGMTSIVVSWKQNIPGPDILVIPKGSPNKEAAMKLLAIAGSAKGQADFANELAYAPINSEAVALVNKDMVPFLPSSHPEDEVPLGLEYWADNVEDISKRWYAWQAA